MHSLSKQRSAKKPKPTTILSKVQSGKKNNNKENKKTHHITKQTFLLEMYSLLKTHKTMYLSIVYMRVNNMMFALQTQVDGLLKCQLMC